MSDEKIVITDFEVETVEVPSIEIDPATIKLKIEPDKPPRRWKRVLVAVAIMAFLFSVGGMMAYCVTQSIETYTVAQYRDKFVEDANKELENPQSKLRKYVEDAHLTVKVSEAHVISCEMTTKDGTDKAGKDGENVQDVTITMRFSWSGLVYDGTTDLRIVLDAPKKKVLKTEVVRTDALVDLTDTKFWYNVGYLLGAILAA